MQIALFHLFSFIFLHRPFFIFFYVLQKFTQKVYIRLLFCSNRFFSDYCLLPLPALFFSSFLPSCGVFFFANLLIRLILSSRSLNTSLLPLFFSNWSCCECPFFRMKILLNQYRLIFLGLPSLIFSSTFSLNVHDLQFSTFNMEWGFESLKRRRQGLTIVF